MQLVNSYTCDCEVNFLYIIRDMSEPKYNRRERCTIPGIRIFSWSSASLSPSRRQHAWWLLHTWFLWNETSVGRRKRKRQSPWGDLPTRATEKRTGGTSLAQRGTGKARCSGSSKETTRKDLRSNPLVTSKVEQFVSQLDDSSSEEKWGWRED